MNILLPILTQTMLQAFLYITSYRKYGKPLPCNQQFAHLTQEEIFLSLCPHTNCSFTGSKIFCASPIFLSHPKNLTAFSASSKSFVPAQKVNLLNENNFLVWHKIFVTDKICVSIFVLTTAGQTLDFITDP